MIIKVVLRWVIWAIGIDTNIEVIVISSTTWEAHRGPRAVVSFLGWIIHNLFGEIPQTKMW